MNRVLARNICSNWAGFVVQAAITFFLTPYILNQIGSARYGIWVLATTLTGYYGLLSMGLGAGTTQQITKTLAEGNRSRFNRTVSTSLAALSICGLITVFVSLLIAGLAPWIFSLSSGVTTEARLCILILGGSTAVQFALFPFAAIFTATQRYDLSNLIGITTRVFSAVGVVSVLATGHGLVALVTVTAICDTIGYLARWKVATRLVPTLKLSTRLIDRGSIVSIAAYSLWNALIAAGQRLVSSAGILVVGITMAEIAIAPFAMALQLVQYFTRLLGSAAIVFYPAAAGAFARKDRPEMRRLLIGGSRLLLLLAVCGAIPGLIWSYDFYELWIPEELAEWTLFPHAATLFVVLLTGAAAGAAALVGEQIVLGAHRLRLLALLTITEGVLSITLSAALQRSQGLMGIALGTSIAAVFVRTVLFPIVACRLVQIPFTRFMASATVRPMLVALLLGPSLYLLHAAFSPIDSWIRFVMSSLIAVTICCGVSVVVGLDVVERQRFVVSPLKSLLGKAGILSSETARATETN